MKTLLTLAAAAAVLSACTSAVDLRAVESERTRALHRYDIIQALSGNGEVVVGSSQAGAVVVSKDQGKSWVRTVLGPVSIIGLATCPDGSFVGIDFNHKVWSADQQGGHWKSVALDKPRTPLAVSCDGQGRWWVAGSGAKIALSTDRGGSWTVHDLQEDAQFTAIQMIDDKHGIVLGEFGHVVTSEDGGASWKKLAQIPGEFYPYAALFRDVKEGWTSGLAGQILHTTDGGRTWAKQENRSGAPLYRLFFHEGSPYGVGAGGVVAKLDGNVWQSVSYPDAVPVFLGAGASLGEKQAALVVGGPGGLARAIATGQPAGSTTAQAAPGAGS
jgi:photosystem II stability/assembly factor-like uncharacterized protein